MFSILIWPGSYADTDFVKLCPVAVVPPREYDTIGKRVKAVDVVAIDDWKL